MTLLTLRPDANGDVIGLTSGSGANWTNVDEAVPDEGATINYKSSGASYDAYDLYGLQDHTSESGTINSVTAYARVSYGDANGGGFDSYIKIKTVATEYTSAAKGASTSWVTKSQAWTTNPNTGAAWTWAQVDALQAGVRLVGEMGNTKVTQVYVEVDYTSSTAYERSLSVAAGLSASLSRQAAYQRTLVA